jgi:isopropylmalate/homocitrate/citramalate synthase
VYEGRDLKKEVEELGIVAIEDIGFGSKESTFAAFDAIREHNKQFPEQKLAQMMEEARREAYENMAGTKNRQAN